MLSNSLDVHEIRPDPIVSGRHVCYESAIHDKAVREGLVSCPTYADLVELDTAWVCEDPLYAGGGAIGPDPHP